MTTIGIDLGTSNSLVAYWDGDQPVLIPNVFGEVLTPSVVGVDKDGVILVGQTAKERLTTHPDKTVAAFKRQMGTQKNYLLGEHTFTAVDLSAIILKTLKQDAENFLEHPCEDAVISVPAYFNDTQRKATLDAAYLAGLKVDKLISEPTAAAIAYGIHDQELDMVLAIFDLGGGTFDVSIIEMFEGVMQVVAISGDNFLGGEDFTKALFHYFLKYHQLSDSMLELEEKAQLLRQIEEAKQRLGELPQVKISARIAKKEYEMVVTQELFAEISEPLLAKMRGPIVQALNDAGFKPQDLDQIILIGGATKMQVVKSFASRFLGKVPFMYINPDQAVGLGTAVQIALKERHHSVENFIMTDVCAYTLGTEVVEQLSQGKFEENVYLPIIDRNTPIPVSKVKRLVSIFNNQECLRIQIFQGESRKTDGNLKLGELEVKLPPASPAGYPVDVRYTYDKNGVLEVLVTLPLLGETKRLVLQNGSTNLSQKELDEQLEKLAAFKVHPRDKQENLYLLARAEVLYQRVLAEKREIIGQLIREFEMLLDRQDEREIRKAVAEFKKKLDTMESQMLW
ncbi:molecular chaperone HscC [Listeria costaricensis]|uniref:molecular chaperone HscC n=1 Tax=Listeria costaricensis TaxID=2026604 RepID=UPI000C0773FD|nr:molecular chaperone HscC [Listeria costaricensis]